MGYPKGVLSRDFLHEIAEPLEGEFVESVAEKSKEKHTVVVLPIFEKEDSLIFNTAVIIDRGKVRGGYRKIHLFDALGYKESKVFRHGSELVLFDVGEMTFGVVTCYDIRFPELVKKEAMSGAVAIIVPAAWFRGPLKEEQWQTLLTARAAENTSYVIGVGNANENFVGRSIVADPFGVKVLDLGYGDRSGRYEIDTNLITNAREKIPVLQQSRNFPDIRCRRLG
jgi:predicted amidohydrolase